MSKMFQWVIAILLLALVAVNVWLVCTIRCHGTMCNGQKPIGNNMMTVPGAKPDSLHTFKNNLSGMYVNTWYSSDSINQGGEIAFKDDGYGGAGHRPNVSGTVWICATTPGATDMIGNFNNNNDSIMVPSNAKYNANTTFVYWIEN